MIITTIGEIALPEVRPEPQQSKAEKDKETVLTILTLLALAGLILWIAELNEKKKAKSVKRQPDAIDELRAFRLRD